MLWPSFFSSSLKFWFTPVSQTSLCLLQLRLVVLGMGKGSLGGREHLSPQLTFF